MHKYAIIVAGGAGLRMGTDTPKQFLHLHGKTLLWHTLKAFTEAYDDIEIILVLPASHLEKGKELATHFSTHQIIVTTGGDNRFESVKKGLHLVVKKSIVMVHDGVRCLVTPELIRRCHDEALIHQTAVVALTATDTVRIETPHGNSQVDRNLVRLMQTPQAFYNDILQKAFEQDFSLLFTDEASVVEKSGVPIYLIHGEDSNIKITKPIDLMIAEKILQARTDRGKQ